VGQCQSLPGTIDTCANYVVAAGTFECSYVFDTDLQGSACLYGAHCCDDGKYHADCSDRTIPVGQDCPNDWCNDWCNDGDPTTLDPCSDYIPAKAQKTCTNVFDAAAEGNSCTYGLYCCADGVVHLDCAP
jgi:hypothetical protein